jgi:hypothetical protein
MTFFKNYFLGCSKISKIICTLQSLHLRHHKKGQNRIHMMRLNFQIHNLVGLKHEYFKPSNVPNIIDFDIIIKMDAFGDDL